MNYSMSRWSKVPNDHFVAPPADPYFKLKPNPATPADEVCSCTDSPPIKLMSLAGLSDNPLHCLRCNGEVPPERLMLEPSEVDAVAHWRSVYGAIDWLELDSGPYESWARSQLLDPASPPNVEGLGVARSLNRVRRCYFWFFQPVDLEGDLEPRSTCPVCERPLTAYDDGLFPQRLCEKDGVVLGG
jgi:hypothetical protein